MDFLRRIFLVALIFYSNNYFIAQDLEYLRKNLDVAVKNEKICVSIIEELTKNKKSVTHLAYLGAYQSILANHLFNPISKLNTFNQGKANIEKAIASDVNNIEARIIRLSIQKNCPKILQYYSDIEKDKMYIQQNKEKIDSPTLKKTITKLL